MIARDTTSAYSAKSGLNDYGIPFEVLVVPQGGVSLPPLSSATGVGNYGGFVVLSEVSYADKNGDYSSALTGAQWSQLYSYQRTFGARMVRLDVVPSADTVGFPAFFRRCFSSREVLGTNIRVTKTALLLNQLLAPRDCVSFLQHKSKC